MPDLLPDLTAKDMSMLWEAPLFCHGWPLLSKFLSCSSGSSGSSGILPAPRTPSNHEQDGAGVQPQLLDRTLPYQQACQLFDSDTTEMLLAAHECDPSRL